MAVSCPKCGGDGVVEKFRNVDKGICYLCGGKGRIEKSRSENKSAWRQRPSNLPTKVPTNVKRRSGKTGNSAPKDKDNKWRSGKTGKAVVKKNMK